MDQNNTVTLQLNIDAISSIAMNSARATADVVGLALQLVEDAGPAAVAELRTKHAMYEFGPSLPDPDRRLEFRRRWLLTKGFQDLTLAVRQALEEADVMLGLAAQPKVKMAADAFNEKWANLRRGANKANLPTLIKRVEGAIGAQLAYSREIKSLNAARNCLEHRAGLVSRADLDDGSNCLTVTFPRTRIFYVHEGQEVEMELPHQMPEAADGAGFDVFMQHARRSIEFREGDVVNFSSEEFVEVTFAVWYFANDLAQKVKASSLIASLPKLAGVGGEVG